DSSKPSNDNTNVVNAPQEPFVVKQDPGKNSSQSPPQINHHCCYEYGNPLEDIFCHQCNCELCGKGAHYGYNCPPKVLVVSNPKSCHNQNVDELPQTLPSFDPTCYSQDGNSFTYDPTFNLVHESPNDFDPPLQPPTYSYEFCGNDAYYGHDCSLQVPFTYDMEPFTPSLSTEEPDNSLSMGDEHLDTILATESDEFIKSSVENLVLIPITPSLSTEKPDNSLSMGDEHLDTVSATESDEFIKSSVENLVLIPSESEGDFTMDVVEDIFSTRKPRIHDHNALPTHPTLQLNLNFILSSESLFAYVDFSSFSLIFSCSSISSILRE
nr:hypothetical protein [Tanacetum cinerariifolium]